MTCKAIERLILESEDRLLDSGERRRVDDHLHDCAGCRSFAAARAMIRKALAGVRWPEPPPAVAARTRQACLEEMGAAAGRTGERRARVPVPVAAAALLFTVLAAVWIAGVLADFTPGQSLPTSAWLALAFIAQNVLMLFLTPVVLGAGRPTGGEETRSARRI